MNEQRKFLVHTLLQMEFADGEHLTREEAEALIDAAEVAMANGRYVQISLYDDDDEAPRGTMQ